MRLRNQAPEQAVVCLVFHQPAADEIGSYHLCWSAEEGVVKGWEILDDGLGGYGGKFGVRHH